MNVLILTAGYGAGHNSAARALEEEFARCHIPVRLEDGLALVPSCSYPISRAFYQFCVNHAGWLWGLTYELTDKADWAKLVDLPFFKPTMQALQQLIRESGSDLILCTYPLFSFMLDKIKERSSLPFRHVAVVTDALEVSRPWVRSQAERVFMTDEYSAKRVAARYAVPESVLQVSSFPSSARFYPADLLAAPSQSTLKILYSAQAPAAQCVDELRAVIRQYPWAMITVIAGQRLSYLQRNLVDAKGALPPHCTLLARSETMAELMREHHLYIGKPGGATMFECYASALPMVVNFALMGQEQGNLELLARDGCGFLACGPSAIVAGLARLLAHDAREWKRMRMLMLSLPRRSGAARIRAYCEDLMHDSNEGITR